MLDLSKISQALLSVLPVPPSPLEYSIELQQDIILTLSYQQIPLITYSVPLFIPLYILDPSKPSFTFDPPEVLAPSPQRNSALDKIVDDLVLTFENYLELLKELT
jgi:hypothetical protein